MEIKSDKTLLNGCVESSKVIELQLDGSCYEVIRIIEGKPLFLKEHLDRLFESVEAANFNYSIDCNIIEKWILDFIKELKLLNENIKILVENKLEMKIVVYVVESHYPSVDVYKEGVKVDCLEIERSNPSVKLWNDNYKTKVAKVIEDKNLFEVLLVNKEDRITEGSRSNVFFLKEETIYTASLKTVLNGITRKKVLEAIQSEGIEVVESELKLSEIKNVEAAFLTGTSIHVLPIREISGKVLKSTESQIITNIRLAFEKLIIKDQMLQ